MAADDDTLFERALTIVETRGHVTASTLQRHFRIGFNRAYGIMERIGRERGWPIFSFHRDRICPPAKPRDTSGYLIVDDE